MDTRLIWTAVLSVGLHTVAIAGWPTPEPGIPQEQKPLVITVNLTPPPPPSQTQQPEVRAIPQDIAAPREPLASLEPDPFSTPTPQPEFEAPEPVLETPISVVSPVYDPEAKLKYEHVLMAYLQNHRKYPRLALRRNLEGSPVVRLTVASSGGLVDVILEESCKFPVLDNAALNLVADAAPFPPLPDDFGQAITYILPIHYQLED